MSPQGREASSVIDRAPAVPGRRRDDALPPDFNLLAPFYRWMEWFSFGPWLGWCRCAFLDDLRNPRKVLVFGDGDGRFTARLLRANPHAQADAVDASSAMLRALVRRAGAQAAQVQTHCHDARSWRPARGVRYHLVVTHFFLDCLTTAEVRALAAQVRAACAPRALWLVSEFAIPQTRFGRRIARPLVGFLYWAFRVLTGLKVRRLPDHSAALAEAGFVLLLRRYWLGGLLVSELWKRGADRRSFASTPDSSMQNPVLDRSVGTKRIAIKRLQPDPPA